MENQNDSLARLAHAHGMTDLEFEERSRIEAEVAAQQVIRRWQEEEEADWQTLRDFEETCKSRVHPDDIDWSAEANTDFSILTDEEMAGDW